jgi:hypothetical protein
VYLLRIRRCRSVRIYEVQYVSIDILAMESELGKEHTEEE